MKQDQLQFSDGFKLWGKPGTRPGLVIWLASLLCLFGVVQPTFSEELVLVKSRFAEGNQKGIIKSENPDCVVSGTRVCFSAQPYYGYELDHWLINGKPEGNENPICRIVTEDTVFEPRFKKLQVPDKSALTPDEWELFSAIRKHNKKAILSLLKTIGNPDFRPGPGWGTPLFVAIEANDPAIVKILLQAGSDAHQTCRYKIQWPIENRTALQFPWPRSTLETALRIPGIHTEIVKELVNAGESVNQPIGINGRFSPLFLVLQGAPKIDNSPPAPGSTYTVNKDIVNFLIDRGADIHGVNPEGKTILYCTLNAGLYQVASRLMNAGVWNSMTAFQKQDILSLVAGRTNKPEWVKRVLKAGVDIKGPWTTQTHPLLNAIRWNYVSVADILLKNGMDPNVARLEKPETNKNLVKKAIRWTRDPFDLDAILTLLCSYGADINGWVLPDESPITMLTETKLEKQKTGYKRVTVFKRRRLRILISHGFDVAGHTEWTRTPETKWALAELDKAPVFSSLDEKLVVAVASGDADRVRKLLDAGANANVSPGGPGNTPLRAAILSKHLEIIQLLVRHKADLEALIPLKSPRPTYYSHYGLKSVTALGLAILVHQPNAVMTLMKAGANVKRIGLTADTSMSCSAMDLLVKANVYNDAAFMFIVKKGTEPPLYLPAEKPGWGNTSFLAWTIFNHMPAVSQYLIDKGILKQLSTKEREKVLLVALFSINGSKLNQIYSMVTADMTPIQLSILKGKLLIRSIIHYEGQPYFAKEALEWGADPNKGWKLDGKPIPPLSAILEKPKEWKETITEYVNTLLSYGANPDLEYKLPDGTITTPMKTAQAKGNVNFVNAVNNWRNSHLAPCHTPLKNRPQIPKTHKILPPASAEPSISQHSPALH